MNIGNEVFNFDDVPSVNDEAITLEPIVLDDIISNPVERDKDIDDDYVNARNNLNKLEQMSMILAMHSLELSRNSESPKLIEIANASIKLAAELNEKKILQHKKMNDVKGKKPIRQTKIVESTSVFTGTPNDVLEKSESKSED